MDEARSVLARLERIAALERRLLAEVEALVPEAEAWLAVEGPGAERAARTLADVRDRLGTRPS